MSNYQKYPFTFVEEHRGELAAGYDSIIARLFEEYEKSGREDYLIAIDTYPGVRDEEVTAALKTLPCRHFFDMRTVFKPEEELAEQLKYHLTDDRVFGKMYFGELEDLMDPVRLAEMRGKVKEAEGLCMVYGFGAFLAAPPAPSALQSGGSSLRRPDLSLYLDLARWEIQLRYRSGMPNYNCSNFDEDTNSSGAILSSGGSPTSTRCAGLTGLTILLIPTGPENLKWRQEMSYAIPCACSQSAPSAQCPILTPASGAASG